MDSLFSPLPFGVCFLRFLGFVLLVLWPLGALGAGFFLPTGLSRGSRIFLALLAGTTAATLIYWGLRMGGLPGTVFSMPWTFIPLPLFLLFQKVLKKRQKALTEASREAGTQGSGERSRAVSTTRRFVLINILLFAAFLSLKMVPMIGGFQWESDGALRLSRGFYSDMIWKVSVMSELEHSVPPASPVLAGYPLTYHYFSDLFGVMIFHATGIDFLSLRYYLLPVFFFLLMGWAAYHWIGLLFREPLLRGLGFALVLLTMYSMDTHQMFALASFLGAAILLGAEVQRRCRANLVLAGFLLVPLPLIEAVYALVFFWAFMVAACVDGVRTRKGHVLLLMVLTAATAFGIRKYAFGSAPTPAPSVTLNFPFLQGAVICLPPVLKNILKSVLEHFSLDLVRYQQQIPDFIAFAKQCGQAVAGLFRGQGETGRPILWGALLISPLIVLYGLFRQAFFTFQIALAAIPRLFQKVRMWRQFSFLEMLIFPAVLFWGLFPLFFTFDNFWNAGPRILALAVVFASLYVAEQIFHWFRARRFLPAVLVLAVFAVYFPMKDFLSSLSRGPQFSIHAPQEMEIFRYLRQRTPAAAVVMHPFLDDPIFDPKVPGRPAWVFEDHYYYVSAFGGRRALLEGSEFLAQSRLVLDRPDQIREIRAHIREVYTSPVPERVREILSRYKVDYLWATQAMPLAVPVEGFLKPVIKNEAHVLYEVISPEQGAPVDP